MLNKSVSPGAWRIAQKTARFALSDEENTVYSPVCIREGLQAMRLGAAGDTAAELDALIGSAPEQEDPYGLSPLHEWAYKGYRACAASGIWLDLKARPEQRFKDACARNGANLEKTDLSRPEAGEEIARWIADTTDGLVKPSIKLDPLALACVASALYLKDAWVDAFPKNGTRRKPFRTGKGNVLADFMASTDVLPVADYDFGTLVTRPLSHGASMTFVLPKEDVTLGDLVRGKEALDAIAKPSASETLVEMHLPKFVCEASVSNMLEALIHAGFESAATPDLRPMVGLAETPTSYAHGTRIAVDENGLEAGSYFTMIAVAGLPSERPPRPRAVVFDKPFLFAVVSRTNQPLFIGTVARPEAKSTHDR